MLLQKDNKTTKYTFALASLSNFSDCIRRMLASWTILFASYKQVFIEVTSFIKS